VCTGEIWALADRMPVLEQWLDRHQKAQGPIVTRAPQ
jgi:hypothetical protein